MKQFLWCYKTKTEFNDLVTYTEGAWEQRVKQYRSSAGTKYAGTPFSTVPVVYTRSAHHALQSFKFAIISMHIGWDTPTKKRIIRKLCWCNNVELEACFSSSFSIWSSKKLKSHKFQQQTWNYNFTGTISGWDPRSNTIWSLEGGMLDGFAGWKSQKGYLQTSC